VAYPRVSLQRRLLATRLRHDEAGLEKDILLWGRVPETSVQGLELRGQGLGLRAWGLIERVLEFGCRVEGNLQGAVRCPAEFLVEGLGFRLWGLD